MWKSVRQIGRGKGKELGYPTINFAIPEKFDLRFGIYGVRVFLHGVPYIGAMHYGPIPNYDISYPTLEIHIIDEVSVLVDFDKEISFEVGNHIRDIQKFSTEEDLKQAIEGDIIKIKKAYE
jgi:riboflavin kinase / FMN adenylyltransferase